MLCGYSINAYFPKEAMISCTNYVFLTILTQYLICRSHSINIFKINKSKKIKRGPIKIRKRKNKSLDPSTQKYLEIHNKNFLSQTLDSTEIFSLGIM